MMREYHVRFRERFRGATPLYLLDLLPIIPRLQPYSNTIFNLNNRTLTHFKLYYLPMKIANYKTLISSLPVRQQSFTTKRMTWLKAEMEVDWLAAINDYIFNNKKSINISKQDIFNGSHLVRESILRTIYWGYTRGMRGNHFIHILNKIHHLENVLTDLKNTVSPNSYDYSISIKELRNILGLGLSTYTKLLYFFDIKFH